MARKEPGGSGGTGPLGSTCSPCSPGPNRYAAALPKFAPLRMVAITGAAARVPTLSAYG
jgi:hypothetical protein